MIVPEWFGAKSIPLIICPDIAKEEHPTAIIKSTIESSFCDLSIKASHVKAKAGKKQAIELKTFLEVDVLRILLDTSLSAIGDPIKPKIK